MFNRMFWRSKNDDQSEKDIANITEISSSVSTVSHAQYTDLDLRRAVLEWRDKHTEGIELLLSRELASLYSTLDEKISEMTIPDLFSQNKFARKYLEPIYQEWLKRELNQFTNSAQAELSEIRIHSMEYPDQESSLDPDDSTRPIIDAAVGVTAIGAGLAAIPAVATMSVSSAGGILGLLGITTVSWPVVVIGIATVGGLLALGGTRAADLKSRATSQLRKKLRQSIGDQVMGYEGNEESVRHRLQACFDQEATKLLLDIDK